MARVYEAGAAKTSSAAAGPIALVSAGTRRTSILELGIFATTAVAGEIGIGRPGSAPTASASVTVQPMDISDEAGTTLLTTAFSAAPGAPSTPMRRIQLPATIGAGVIWTWAPGELIIPSSTSSSGLLIWQYTTAAVGYDVYVKVLE